MAQDWMIDVLADLRDFARQNGFAVLSEQLEDTILVAAAELSQAAVGGPIGQDGSSAANGACGTRRDDRPAGFAGPHPRASGQL